MEDMDRATDNNKGGGDAPEGGSRADLMVDDLESWRANESGLAGGQGGAGAQEESGEAREEGEDGSGQVVDGNAVGPEMATEAAGSGDAEEVEVVLSHGTGLVRQAPEDRVRTEERQEAGTRVGEETGHQLRKET